jgi:hypothetical protein
MKIAKISKTSKLNKLCNDPRTKKVVAFTKANWKEVLGVVAITLLLEDIDTAADMAEGSFIVDVLTARAAGVI